MAPIAIVAISAPIADRDAVRRVGRIGIISRISIIAGVGIGVAVSGVGVIGRVIAVPIPMIVMMAVMVVPVIIILGVGRRRG